jgi:signal transduction histidine kinase
MTFIKTQVFSNLMGNAVKFARPAGNRLSARKYPSEKYETLSDSRMPARDLSEGYHERMPPIITDRIPEFPAGRN